MTAFTAASPNHSHSSLPILSPLARALARGLGLVYALISLLVLAVAGAVALWGLPVLGLVAVAATPMMLGLLLFIARP